MLVGVPGEVKNHEYRVGLTPESVAEMAHHGHRVIVQSRAGTGIGASDMDRLMQRGERLDLSGAGAGLGLSIVGDVAAAYGGSVALRPSALGGLAVDFCLAHPPRP